MRCFFDRESVSAENLLPGNSGNQATTMTSFTLSTHHYPTVCVLACSSLPLSILLGSAQFSQFTSPCIHRRHPFDTLFAHLTLCARGAVARFLLLEHHSTREGPCSHNAQICEMRNGMRVRCGGIGLFVRVCVWGHIACILSFLRTLFAFCLL